MVQTWANFVKTGSPHTNDINNWSRFSGNGNKVMMFKPDAIAEFDAYTNHHCEFWNALDPSLNPIN
jgi:carboxylesterase type B